MGAMKAIYTDIQELQEASMRDEEQFIAYIEQTGWTSPTEREIRNMRLRDELERLQDTERAFVQSVLSRAGINISPVDFPIGSVPPMALVSA